MRQGIRVICRLQFQPGALGVLFQQALTFQAATYPLADKLHQVIKFAFMRRFEALKSEWSIASIYIDAIQKQDVKMYIEV